MIRKKPKSVHLPIEKKGEEWNNKNNETVETDGVIELCNSKTQNFNVKHVHTPNLLINVTINMNALKHDGTNLSSGSKCLLNG